MTTASNPAVEPDYLRRARRDNAAQWAMVVCITLLIGVALSVLWPPRALDTSVDTGPR